MGKVISASRDFAVIGYLRYYLTALDKTEHRVTRAAYEEAAPRGLGGRLPMSFSTREMSGRAEHVIRRVRRGAR